MPVASFLRCPDVNGDVWSVKGLLSHFVKQLPGYICFGYENGQQIQQIQ